ncbi:glycosyltransferase [Saccharothrix sp. AJ9571]|nr:glycosyltransferase [Saccharothrix sp. AJ9571]
MRVLHVISEMGTGGAEALVGEMVHRGPGFGWISGVASGGGHRAEALDAQGVPLFTVPVARRTAGGVLRAARLTRTAVRKFRPDVVIAHNVSASVSAKLAIIGQRVPLLTVFHGVAEADYRTSARILRHTSDVVVAVAPVIAGRLRSAGLPRPKVIRNAVALPSEMDSREAVRASLRLSAGVPVALCLARLEPQKRHDVLLDAWAKVSGDAILLIAGDGSLCEELQERSAELGLGDRVRFLGDRTDGPALLAAADVTVLTSDWEGLPIALLESLAAERPVVATDVDGVREVLSAGGGLLVPPGEPDAVAQALRKMLDDPGERSCAAAAGLATIRREYHPDALMESYDELLRSDLLGGRR